VGDRSISKLKKKIKNERLRLPDDAPIPFPLRRTGRCMEPLELKIKKNKKKCLRLPDDTRIPFSLTGTGRGGWPLALKFKKIEIKIKK
jgi:hypothetical protein